MKKAKEIHSLTTALLMWSASALLQVMAAAGLIHATIELVWPNHDAARLHPIVSTVLASVALIELAWMSASWAMEHRLRLAFLLDVCMIFIAREVIDRVYTEHLTPSNALVIISVFLAFLAGRWLTPKIYGAS